MRARHAVPLQMDVGQAPVVNFQSVIVEPEVDRLPVLQGVAAPDVVGEDHVQDATDGLSISVPRDRVNPDLAARPVYREDPGGRRHLAGRSGDVAPILLPRISRPRCVAWSLQGARGRSRWSGCWSSSGGRESRMFVPMCLTLLRTNLRS